MMTWTRFFFVVVVIFTVNVSNCLASIQINTTRVIYHSSKSSVSVQVINPGNYPVLLQSWIDNGNSDTNPDSIHAPFVLTPPLTRVNAGDGQTFRLTYTGEDLPKDRESVYWLNILEIPPLEKNQDQNQIQVAFRSRIKLFYRPDSLDDNGAESAMSQLYWSSDNNQLILKNPTPYHISVINLTISEGDKKTVVSNDMIGPNESTFLSLPSTINVNNIDSITATIINDYGAPVMILLSHQ